MPRPTDRKDVLDKLKRTIAEGKVIVGAGAGRNRGREAARGPPLTLSQELACLPSSSKRVERI
ncbi:hypothetical protein L228DRAFT_246307 [Xylona heveae TC161]|uniref:Uncharacterized protein n=1 Tax=Xylona heveae (strain CBS 132557 / TC161) TaxID=1328760 RepID=A0A165HHN5_XYLHT|nr:hypothetical protein L228DRAFT_246307 [Xylona heveae TC161]KZF23533.1 hypothetical protein L228DRAFT_246307 [Xylona heveae TC161]